MAKEYVEREAALKATCEYCCEHDSCNSPCVEYLQAAELTAAEVVEVRHGRWELGGMFGDIGRCSNCHYMFPADTAMSEFHYCPNCGAKMDGGQDDV